MLLSGCASLDPTDDIAKASSLVTQRSDAETGWESPWHETALHWDGVSPLSSDVAVRIALQNNRAIRQQVEMIVASRADFVQAHLLPNPVINFAYGFPLDSGGGNPLMSSVVQQLAWIWRRPAMIEAADARLQAQVMSVSDAALDLVAQVRSGCAEVHYARRAVQLQEKNEELLEQSLQLLQVQFEVGEASRIDLNRVELDLRGAEVRLADRRSALELSKRRLLELLGRAEAGTEWQVSEAAPSTTDFEDELNEERVIYLASTYRLDVAAMNMVVSARAADVNLEKANRNPDVNVGFSYQKNFSNRDAAFPAVGITPKLFDDNSARVAKAASELRQAEIEADRVRQAAVTEARVAWVELEAQREVVQVYETNILILARSNLMLAQEAFQAGESDLTVLLESQRRINDAGIELVDRQFAFARLLIEVERAVGGSLEEPPLDEAVAMGAIEASQMNPTTEVVP